MMEGILTILGSVLLGIAIVTSVVLWADKQAKQKMQTVLIKIDQDRNR